MIYDFDIPLILRRYAPVWFRHDANIQWASTLCAWLGRIHARFLLLRANDVLPLYRYNGLVHSLEWMLNDLYDAVDRRIHITIEDQAPHYYHETLGSPGPTSLINAGDLSGYYHLDDNSVAGVYLYEFVVHVPQSIGFVVADMFRRIDVYRYAGRRPAIRLYDPLNNTTTAMFFHPSALEIAANHP